LKRDLGERLLLHAQDERAVRHPNASDEDLSEAALLGNFSALQEILRIEGLGYAEGATLMSGTRCAMGSRVSDPAFDLPDLRPQIEDIRRGHLYPVTEVHEVEPTERRYAAGVDLDFELRQPPLRAAKLATAPGIAFRVGVLRYDLSLITPNLGGDTSGFSSQLEIPMSNGELRPFIVLAGGLEDHGNVDHYAIAALGLGLDLGMLSFLTARIMISPNALALIDLAGKGSADAHYYTPVKTALMLDLGPRFFVEGSAVEYLGSSLQHPVQIGVLGGLRL
jgi:hypothetical protein